MSARPDQRGKDPNEAQVAQGGHLARAWLKDGTHIGRSSDWDLRKLSVATYDCDFPERSLSGILTISNDLSNKFYDYRRAFGLGLHA